MLVGSSKHKSSKKKPPEDRSPAPPSTKAQPSLGEVVEALRAQQVEIARISELLQHEAATRASLARQCERILELQQRTNTLLELSLGSAFDFELEGPPPGGR
jgi:hypothetical protein